MPRRLVAVVVLMLYLLAGALHSFCGLDVVSGPRETVVSLTSGAMHGQDSDEASGGGHHCHGCFSVSVPASLTASASAEPARALPIVFRDVERDGRKTGIDPPPPKFLA